MMMQSIVITHASFAHTISQHLQEIYSETYMPLIVISKILPFFALGFLSHDQKSIHSPVQNSWILLFGLILGALTTFVDANLIFLMVTYNLVNLFVGLMLLLLNKPPGKIIIPLLLIFGFSVGYENTLSITHVEEFRWLFIATLLIGFLIFKHLSKYQFYSTGIRNAIRIITGLFLAVAGLIVIILTY